MGRKIRPGLYIEPDFREEYAAAGFIKSMLLQMDSSYFMNDVIGYAHSRMAQGFDDYMTVLSQSNENRYHHVYEPGMVGFQEAQLWEHRLYGTGDKRQVSWEWQLSRLPILKPEERAMNPDDPMSEVDSEVIEKLSDEDYVFYMRAPMMEYGLRANIVPTNAKFLFIPTFATQYFRDRKARTSREVNFRMAKHNVPNFSYHNPQEPSGAGGGKQTDGTVGQFTAAWVGYWTQGPADEVFNMEVQPYIETSMGEAEQWIGKAAKQIKSRKVRSVGASFTTFADHEQAEETGRNLAIAFVKGKARSYRQASKHVDKYGYFNGEQGY